MVKLFEFRRSFPYILLPLCINTSPGFAFLFGHGSPVIFVCLVPGNFQKEDHRFLTCSDWPDRPARRPYYKQSKETDKTQQNYY